MSKLIQALRTGHYILGPREAETLAADELEAAWQKLEDFGFPKEACGWPTRDMTGVLPEAIECALDCIIRQREDLIREAVDLRERVRVGLLAATVDSLTIEGYKNALSQVRAALSSTDGTKP